MNEKKTKSKFETNTAGQKNATHPALRDSTILEELVAAIWRSKGKQNAKQKECDPKYWGVPVASLEAERLLVQRDGKTSNSEIRQVLRTLTAREESVLRLRYGLDDGKPRTLQRIGDRFGFTRQGVQQIETKAIQKLRHPQRAQRLKDFLDRLERLAARSLSL